MFFEKVTKQKTQPNQKIQSNQTKNVLNSHQTIFASKSNQAKVFYM